LTFLLTTLGVSKAIVQQIRDTERIRIRRFDFAKKLIIVTIPTYTHEVTHAQLYQEITAQIALMGLNRLWLSKAARAYKAPNGDEGEGDSFGGPRPERAQGWPTLVIEAEYSESMPRLYNDMR
jgi:hypothetical protein